MIRVAFVADTHADTSSRWDEHCRIMQWIATDIASREVGLVCHAGDIFDGQSNPTERHFVADWIKTVAEYAPMVIVAGNHERPLDVEFLQRLHTRLPVIATEKPRVINIGHVSVAMLPWPRKANLLAALPNPVSHAESQAVAVKALQDILRGLGAKLQEYDGPRVLLSHSMISGSKTDSRQPIVGADMEVSLADLTLARADIVVAGHVHAEQSWNVGGVPIIYPGCPYHRDFGEPGPCSYVIAEFEPGQLVQWTRVVVPARQMLLLKAEWDGHALIGPHRLLDVAGAEIRVQYTVPADQRDVAALRAAEDKATMLERGAALVKMDEMVEPTTRARVPEITTVRTLEDKLDVLWTAKGTVPEPERRAGIFTRLAVLEHEIPVTASAGGAIRFDRLRGHGIWRFADFDINLRELPGVIVAVTGRNGAGKTTLLECFDHLLFREGPTRGALKDNVSGTDGWLEGTFVNGSRYDIRQVADGVHGGGSASVVGPHGPIQDAAGITPYLAWAKKHIPSREVLHASQFIFQGSGGFLALGEAARKAVLLRALGIERLEKLSELARKRARETETSLTTLAERTADEKARGMDVGTAQAELDAARAAEGNADAELASARHDLECRRREHDRLIRLQQDAEETRERRAAIQKRLDDAQRKVQDLTARAERARELTSQATEIRAAIHRLTILALQVSDAQATQARVQAEADAAKREQDQHEQAARAAGAKAIEARSRVSEHRASLARLRDSQRAKLADLETRLKNNRGLLDRADEIRAAQAEDQRLATEATKLEQELALARRDFEQATKDAIAHELRKVDAFGRQTTAQKRAESARARLAQAAAIETAAREIPARQEAVKTAAAELQAAEQSLEAMRGQRVGGAEERIGKLRTALGVISEGETEQPVWVAREALDADDATVRLKAELPKQIREAEETVSLARAAHETTRINLSDAERLAARAGEIAQARDALRSAEDDAAVAAHDRDVEQLAIDQSKACAEQARPVITEAEAKLGEIARTRKTLTSLIAHADKLAQAEARISELEPQIETARQDVTNTENTIAAQPEVDPEVQAADLAASEAAAKASAAGDRVALARTELDRLAGVLRDLASERATLEPVAAKLDALTKAEALASDLQSQVTTAEAEKTAIEAELATVPDPGAIALPNTAAQEAAVQAAEKGAQDSKAAVAVAETKLHAAREREEKLERFTEERRQLEDELSDWTRLGQDLGRGGLQAIEIDAAGPSLTEMINDLLHAVSGTRWTVSVETARWNKDGDKQIEGCEIQVIDTRTGYTGPADRLSGGEKVMVGEAVSLAISLLSCKRAGMEGITLVRDEAGAALDPENAPLYVKMMRRAAEIVKADKVLFVSHQPDAVAEADSKIVIEDGSIRTAA